MLTLYEVLRALVGGDRVLNDATWIARAMEAIDAAEAKEHAAAPAEPAAEPEEGASL